MLKSIKVDKVSQGKGTTNTGNMARRCFQQPIKFAQGLEIDEKLVCDIATIIATFKCKMPLKLDVLEKFCWETYFEK